MSGRAVGRDSTKYTDVCLDQTTQPQETNTCEKEKRKEEEGEKGRDSEWEMRDRIKLETSAKRQATALNWALALFL